MIEAVTYRLSFHNTSDNPALYRDPAEVARAEELDPVARVVAYAEAQGIVDAAALEALTVEVRDEVATALDRALSYPTPGPEDVFRHVWAEGNQRGSE